MLKRKQHSDSNIKQYLLATLYNASVTVDSYYSAQVRRDMGWGGRVDKTKEDNPMNIVFMSMDTTALYAVGA